MRHVAGLVDMLCIALFLVVSAQTVWVLKSQRGSADRQDEDMRVIYNGVLASSVLLWPVIFDATIGLSQLFAKPKLLVGFFWPIVLGLTELNYVSRFSTTTGAQGRAAALFQQADLNVDTTMIISAAFAMGSLLLGSRRNTPVNYMIMYALLFCVAFLVPTLQIPPETKESIMWRSVQKVVLNYAIGFTIAGISTDILGNVFTAPDAGIVVAAATAAAAPDVEPTATASLPPPPAAGEPTATTSTVLNSNIKFV